MAGIGGITWQLAILCMLLISPVDEKWILPVIKTLDALKPSF